MSTIADIARRVGVSHVTVSNVLNGRTKGVRSDALRRADRIRRVAAEMGYRPHAGALAMNRGRFNAVAIVTAVDHGYLPSGFQRGLAEELDNRQHRLVLSVLPHHKANDPQFVPNVLRELSVDGLLLDFVGGSPPERLAHLIESHAIPALWFNHQRDHDCICIDDRGAARQLTRWFLGRGHRRIAYLGTGEGGHYSEHDRRQGYADVMAEAGLPAIVEHLPDGRGRTSRFAGNGSPDAMDAVRRAIGTGRNRATAVLTYSESLLPHVQYAALERGLRVPEDIAVGTFSNHPARLLDARPVPTMHMHQRGFGEAAARLVLSRIQSPNQPMPPVHLPMNPLLPDSDRSF